MPRGPTPKNPATRARRNKAATAAAMDPELNKDRVVPPLPSRPRGKKWHPMTVAMWEDIWRSPMAAEYLQADLHGLYILVELVDAFHRTPSIALAAEIRQHRIPYGITPIDRRRLDWVVKTPSDAKKKETKKGMRDARPTAGNRFGALRAI